MSATQLILASASPRRKHLLKQIGLSFKVDPSKIVEPAFTGSDPVQFAKNLASEKASALSDKYPSALVVGADTIVVIGGDVLGKPVDADEARKMLRQLSGRIHQVITAYAFRLKSAEINQVYHVLTQVHFKKLNQDEIDTYIATGGPFDKAGAYGIQDYSSVFVNHIEGCFYNVVGLPISDFNENLNKLLNQYSLTLK